MMMPVLLGTKISEIFFPSIPMIGVPSCNIVSLRQLHEALSILLLHTRPSARTFGWKSRVEDIYDTRWIRMCPMHCIRDIQPEGFPYYRLKVWERVEIIEIHVTIGRSLG